MAHEELRTLREEVAAIVQERDTLRIDTMEKRKGQVWWDEKMKTWWLFARRDGGLQYPDQAKAATLREVIDTIIDPPPPL